MRNRSSAVKASTNTNLEQTTSKTCDASLIDDDEFGTDFKDLKPTNFYNLQNNFNKSENIIITINVEYTSTSNATPNNQLVYNVLNQQQQHASANVTPNTNPVAVTASTTTTTAAAAASTTTANVSNAQPSSLSTSVTSNSTAILNGTRLDFNLFIIYLAIIQSIIKNVRKRC